MLVLEASVSCFLVMGSVMEGLVSCMFPGNGSVMEGLVSCRFPGNGVSNGGTGKL